jgi:hypothetical protein
MMAIDFDTQTYNTVAGLQADVAAAQAAYDTAKAASDALTQRLSAFSTELGVAKERLSTAESDKAAADAAEKSVAGSLLEALKAARQALIIYASARSTLEIAEAVAQQALVAGYDVAETLSYVTTASAKNSYITRKLLVAAEQAAGGALLVVASLVNLQLLVSGYTRPRRSNEAELPSALLDVPALSLSGVHSLSGKIDAAVVRSFDLTLLKMTPELGAPPSGVPVSADLLAFAVAEYMKSTERTRAAKIAALAVHAARPKDAGLQPGFQRVHGTAHAYETEIMDATMLTQKAATEASQELSRKAARLQTAQAALAAAQQAAGT